MKDILYDSWNKNQWNCSSPKYRAVSDYFVPIFWQVSIDSSDESDAKAVESGFEEQVENEDEEKSFFTRF